jgi:hypothetical protein
MLITTESGLATVVPAYRFMSDSVVRCDAADRFDRRLAEAV